MRKTFARTMTAVALVMLLAECAALRAAEEQLPELPGTRWQLLSLTGKDEKIVDAKNPADVEFNKDGTWGILHYGGRREAGKYTVKGGRLVMKDESGDVYQDAKMTWKPATKILELDSGDYLMRLRRMPTK